MKITLDDRTTSDFDQASEECNLAYCDNIGSLNYHIVDWTRTNSSDTRTYNSKLSLDSHQESFSQCNKGLTNERITIIISQNKDSETSMRVHVEWMLDQAHRVNGLGGD